MVEFEEVSHPLECVELDEQAIPTHCGELGQLGPRQLVGTADTTEIITKANTDAVDFMIDKDRAAVS